MKQLFDDKNLHRAFEISLILKGVFALLEIVGGIVAYFITQQFLLNLILAFTQEELTQDPNDVLAQFLIRSAENFSISSQLFTSFYLLSHGIIKTFLIAGLLRGKLSYYPPAIIVFVFFIAYQLYRFNFTHSIWLLLITVLDVIVIWLTWHEYTYLRQRGES